MHTFQQPPNSLFVACNRSGSQYSVVEVPKEVSVLLLHLPLLIQAALHLDLELSIGIQAKGFCFISRSGDDRLPEKEWTKGFMSMGAKIWFVRWWIG